ncbi:mechanosensitive ion channel family protein [Clostridiisalibacter paucivorans]|uniref:mechanosensitive ion channel family protein n=1 Tax=Clostridiisalibacter paucivorans TaxID=408753 RepID=UPI000479B848|nr:mechanosensitive ion channel family protein [Clostridiisalibacter paucivorans]
MEKLDEYISVWLSGDNSQLSILEKGIKIVIILILIRVGIKVCHVIIDKFFDQQKSLKYRMEDRKAKTLSAILKSVVKYVIYFIGIIPILEIFGIQTTSILATAGIGGLAIGFGAQNLVRDVITGFFILFEDQFSVGDYINTSDFEGIVEELGIRVTKIRDFNGDLHIIPNGKIEIVTNRSKGSVRAWVDVGIAYEEDIDNAINVLNKLMEEIKETNKNIVEGPTVLGVSNLGSSDVVLSIVAQTKSMEKWSVEREIRKKIKDTFDREGIEIPYPRRVVIDKDS